RLPRRLPYHVAMEIALTGDPLTADVAQHHGLVNRVVEPGGALDGALELAAAVAANGPLALAATKEILRRSLDWSEEEGWKRQTDIMAPVFSSADAREGATAFAEKRPPRWQGK
ncbi:MAG: enoyl-CoA hydratase, partial [Frankiaceae bacterium]|nr:enoyl-CoA hydratase [Frankiaceae bacterium]